VLLEKERAKECAAATPTPVTQPPAAPAPASGRRKNNEIVPYRRSSQQVDKQHAAELKLKREFVEGLKSASNKYYQVGLMKGKKLNAEQHDETHNAGATVGAQLLEGWRIRHHVSKGFAGLLSICSLTSQSIYIDKIR